MIERGQPVPGSNLGAPRALAVDLATNGGRFDRTPTLRWKITAKNPAERKRTHKDLCEFAQQFYEYLERIDLNLRDRAKRALIESTQVDE